MLCLPESTHPAVHTRPPHGCGYNKGVRYSRGGPGSHRKWSSQIRLSAVQMMKSQREVKAHARRAQRRAEGRIPSTSPEETWTDRPQSRLSARAAFASGSSEFRTVPTTIKAIAGPSGGAGTSLPNIYLIKTQSNQPFSHMQLHANVIRVFI